MEFLPAMRPIVSLAALLHDIGKSNADFQDFLRKPAKHDKLRHEWFSALLFAAFVRRAGGGDETWMRALSQPLRLQELPRLIPPLGEYPFREIPPVAAIVLWLILSHHLLPNLRKYDKETGEEIYDLEQVLACELDKIPSIADVFHCVKSSWGYRKTGCSENDALPDFLLQPLEKSAAYVSALRSAGERLLHQLPLLQKLCTLPALRLALVYCRAALMLGDYNVSSKHPPKTEAPARTSKKIPYANTRPYVDGKGRKRDVLNQTLVAHLLDVEKIARRAICFSHFVNDGARVYDNRFLRKLSPRPFRWQDKAVTHFKTACEAEDGLEALRPSCFIVNMASTGAGKTIANAKLMRAISKDESLRFTVLQGLRSITLQTGDAYREALHLSEDDLTVSVGSAALRDLHERAQQEEDGEDEHWWGTDSLYPYKGISYPRWLEEAEAAEADVAEEDDEEKKSSAKEADRNEHSPIAILFKDTPEARKECRARLETPILVATIDYLTPSTECVARGHYILPLLRMMSSDLILDEIDDYAPEDLPAVSRLVHLAGCFGRNVILSSATMPPGIVKGMAKAYFRGYEIYQSFFQTHRPLVAGWCDEFRADSLRLADGSEKNDELFMEKHEAFVKKRVKSLATQTIVRKAFLQPVNKEILATHDYGAYLRCYLDACRTLHAHHHIPYKDTGKCYSIGVIRVAHITFCAILMRYLAHAELPPDTELRLLAYHSAQTLLLRQEEERYLDGVLHRKPEAGKPELPRQEDMCRFIEQSSAKNILFIVVATPVEEVGRDHDFDWAVIEPSSYRSVIQMAGRVLRHRKPWQDIAFPNIAILQYNQKGFEDPHSQSPIFAKPGFEVDNRHVLATRDIERLIPAELLAKIDSSPRIQHPAVIDEKHSMIGLEHVVADEFADGGEHAADTIEGWASPSSFFFLTGLVQTRHPFRASHGEVDIYLRHKENTVHSYDFRLMGDDGTVSIAYPSDVAAIPAARLWLVRDYQRSLERLAEEKCNDGTLVPRSPDGELTDEDFWALERKYGMVSSWQNQESGCHASDDMGIFHISETDERNWLTT